MTTTTTTTTTTMVSLIALQLQKYATRIGPIICVAPVCADNTVVAVDCPEVLQSLLDIGVDYSKMERYEPRSDRRDILGPKANSEIFIEKES